MEEAKFRQQFEQRNNKKADKKHGKFIMYNKVV